MRWRCKAAGFQAPKSRTSRSRAGGFTLLELLVVLVIMGLMAAMLMPGLPTAFGGGALRSAEAQAVASLRQARGKAIASAREARYRPEPQAFGRGIAAKVEPADGIRFFPDGTSSGGSLVLTRRGSSSHLDVDWLTGEVRRGE